MEESAQRGHLDHAKWRISSQCSNAGCVEVAVGEDLVAMRDSTDRSGPMLLFSPSEWRAFTDGVRAGQFDLQGPIR